MLGSPPRGRRRRISRQGIVLAAGILAACLVVPSSALAIASTRPAPNSVSGTALKTPFTGTATSSDTNSVEVGSRFTSSVDGTVSSVRFYKVANDTDRHPVALWDSNGHKLASATSGLPSKTSSGWQTVKLPKPVAIKSGVIYTASYLAPHGNYAAQNHGLDHSATNGPLTIPASGGVYKYGPEAFPSNTYLNTNYFVDVTFNPSGADATTPTPTTPPTPTPTTPPTPTGNPAVNTLNLPRIPWEGGSDYWKQFSKAKAAGWSDPDFFPIVIWYNGISSNAEAQYDKSVGINTYIGMDASTPYSLFADNDVFWIGDKLNSSFNDSSKNWVGDFLDDEVDGRYTPAAGREHLQQLVDSKKNDGRFKYTNFTQMVISKDMNQSDAQAYVNNYTDAVSLDMYWYTIPFCSASPFRQNYLIPVNQQNCRTTSSYGKTVKMLRQQDATDGKFQPIWQFVENLNGGPGGGPFTANITPDQLKGAVMSSLINEARGIVYFNQSLSGNCQGGSILRQSQVTPKFCGAAQVQAAKTVDAQIKALAPVLNSQSYGYSFGPGLQTMLKTYNGSAYIFSMIDGSSTPGSRTFQLPAGSKASSVQVVDENRTIPVNSQGQFTDSFKGESSYHIYRIGK